MTKFPAILAIQREGVSICELRSLGLEDLPDEEVLVRVEHSRLN